MATTKTILLNALEARLETITAVKKVTQVLELPAEARNWAPYIGIVDMGERVAIEDATHVRYALTVGLIILKRGTDLNTLIDSVRAIVLSATTTTAIGALNIKLAAIGPVTSIQADDFAAVRMQCEILYASAK